LAQSELCTACYLGSKPLLRIIHKPGWTTKAELAFVNAILEHIGVQVRALDHLQHDLVEAARKVTYEYKDKYDHK
jgi:hypothetical protein